MRSIFYVAIAAFLAVNTVEAVNLQSNEYDSFSQVEVSSDDIESYMNSLDSVYDQTPSWLAQSNTDADAEFYGLPTPDQLLPMVQPFLPMISHLSDQQIIHGLGRLGHMSDGNVCATAKNMFNLNPQQLCGQVRTMASLYSQKSGGVAQW